MFARRFWEIHKYLAKYFQITLLVPSPYKIKNEEKFGIRIKYVNIPCLSWLYLSNYRFNYYLSRALHQIMFPQLIGKYSKDFSIIHEEMAPLPYLSPIYTKNKCILTIHEIKGKMSFDLHGFWGLFPYISEHVLPKIPYSILIAVSKTTYDRLKSLGLNSTLISNGVNTRVFKPIERNSSDVIKILTVGRFVAQKGHKYFLQCARDLIAENQEVDLRFIIIGRGPLEKEIKALIKHFNIENRVTIYKNLTEDKYIEVLQSCDIYVHTNPYQEGFGLSVAEAMSCGKPIVAFNVPGVREVVDKKCAVLVPPRDVGPLTQKILKIISNHKRARDLGRCGRQRAIKYFDWRVSAQKMRSVYNSLLEN